MPLASSVTGSLSLLASLSLSAEGRGQIKWFLTAYPRVYNFISALVAYLAVLPQVVKAKNEAYLGLEDNI